MGGIRMDAACATRSVPCCCWIPPRHSVVESLCMPFSRKAPLEMAIHATLVRNLMAAWPARPYVSCANKTSSLKPVPLPTDLRCFYCSPSSAAKSSKPLDPLM